MKCMITGASGFVGAALDQRLRAEGIEVVATDIRASGGVQALDVTDRRQVSARVGEVAPDVVIHAAALVDDRGAVGAFRRVNVGGTRNIIAACEEHGTSRLVHVSSIAALGLDPGPVVDTTTPLALTTGSPYFDTKAQSEWLVRRAHRRNAISAVIVRPGDVWGPGSDPWVDRPLGLMRSGTPVLIGGGSGLIAHCWIGNLVDGLTAAVTHPEAAGGCFTFHDDETTTLKTYMTALARTAGLPGAPKSIPMAAARVIARGFRALRRLPGVEAPFTSAALTYLNRRTHYSIASSREVLGWAPKLGLSEGMQMLGEALGER